MTWYFSITKTNSVMRFRKWLTFILKTTRNTQIQSVGEMQFLTLKESVYKVTAVSEVVYCSSTRDQQCRHISALVVRALLYRYLVRARTPLTVIWEVPGSNLGPDSDCPNRCFSGFPQFLQANTVTVTSIMPRPLPATWLTIIQLFGSVESELVKASLFKI
jgi:hypothetical protein